MTIGELQRALESKRRVKLIEDKERATFDYIHAELVGKSMARLYSSSATMPDIAEVYPTLFNSKDIEEQKQARRDELSAIRFIQFANSNNKRFEEAQKSR